MKRSAYSYGIKGLSKFTSFQPLARAVMVVSAVAVLATGVTYAALQSQTATLTGNSISTATADLRIGTSASTFSATRTGFSFNNVVPGAVASPTDGNAFYLKNYGAVPMALKVSIGTIPTNVSDVDLNKVYIVLTRVDTSASQKLSVASLVAANTAGGVSLTDELDGGIVAQYKAQVTMDADAFSGQSATIGGIDLVFSGTVIAG
jgi:hypothetical protein